jgi:hypothetical protein
VGVDECSYRYLADCRTETVPFGAPACDKRVLSYPQTCQLAQNISNLAYQLADLYLNISLNAYQRGDPETIFRARILLLPGVPLPFTIPF